MSASDTMELQIMSRDGQAPPLVDVTVVILTLNEEANLEQALRSVCGWAEAVCVLDSGSTDQTTAIATNFGCRITFRQFDNYAAQRNYALTNLGISTEWILFLDADEWVSEPLKHEIRTKLASPSRQHGFYIRRRLFWMGRWIRRGYYPCWLLRLVRKGSALCGDRKVNEHLIVDGPIGYLDHDLIHEDRKGVSAWIAKHNTYATAEAEMLLDGAARSHESVTEVSENLFGTQPERKRWIRARVWNRLPPIVRPFIYFGYRYIARGGFLDGLGGFTFHFLQGLWFPLLIDLKYLELRERKTSRMQQDDPNVRHLWVRRAR